MTEQQFEMASALAERDRMDAIAAAGRMVAAQGAADCEDCDEQIPPERRQAAPFATRCLGCQQAHELAQQHHFFNRFF
ncbi:TraR/DksA C4-type zinc finger protein [Paucibacter sp. O1-1]|nr:TraR/DksA C4-type zinc finger protein [Paucibacter sp. O1-1]MDA3826591.1 TraR/DksA C4-type zinc finger protein [Paucibacter sp. O1-1]